MAAGKTNYRLKKLVTKLQDHDYVVRFEKGNFKTGYCILEDRKVIIVNKFHDLEVKIDNLRQILAQLIAA
ncbi:MAG: hypothetical protein AAFQ02_04075 [Bacteroidota bacterium]